jgi:ParB family chromosome partitioning protein
MVKAKTESPNPTGKSRSSVTKKKGLGKGLGALIPEVSDSSPVDVFFNPQSNLEKLTQESGGYFQEIPINEIRPNPKQPRRSFDEDQLLELAESIKLVGVLEPIRVQQKTDAGQIYFELIMGERRKRASELAGMETIPAIIQFTENDELLRHALFENIHRVNLSPLEEAAAYQQMMNDFGYTQTELAKQVAKGRSTITNILRILKLPAKVQAQLESGEISKGHANAILSLDDPKDMENLANQIVRDHLSVREAEQIAYAPTVVTLDKNLIEKEDQRSALIDEYELSLEEYFNTRVLIKLGGNRKDHGTLRIDFGSMEDLDRIIELINPDLSDFTDE